MFAIVVVAFVVFIERGQRRITVNYAKRQQGRRVYQAQSSHLPLKVNMAGVIPAIFASSLLLAPASLAQWFGQTKGMEWLQEVSLVLSPGQPLYILMFARRHRVLQLLLYGDRVRSERRRRKPADVRGLCAGYPAGSTHGELHR